MKFIKCMYTSFKNSILEVAWRKGDIIVLTKKLATSPVIMEGINTRNFVFVDVSTLTVLSKVVNVTPAITKEFKKRMVAEEEARMEAAKAAAEAAKPLSHPVPQDKGVRPTPPEPEPEPEPPKEEEKVPEDTPQEDEKTEEKTPEVDGDSAEDKTEEPKEEENVIAFTEIAGNVGAAVAAVKKETDIQKLKDALKLDERVTVTNAVVARLEELEAGE